MLISVGGIMVIGRLTQMLHKITMLEEDKNNKYSNNLKNNNNHHNNTHKSINIFNPNPK